MRGDALALLVQPNIGQPGSGYDYNSAIPLLMAELLPNGVLGLGVTGVKVSPAAELSAGWFRAMRGPFPNVRLVATGGVHAGNAEEYLAAGASVVAVGSALEDSEQLARLADLVGGAAAQG